jgi:hypothetical protein
MNTMDSTIQDTPKEAIKETATPKKPRAPRAPRKTATKKPSEKAKKEEPTKPTPPPSQLIKEGQDPKNKGVDTNHVISEPETPSAEELGKLMMKAVSERYEQKYVSEANKTYSMSEQKVSSITDVEVAKKLINIYQSAQDRKLQFNLSFEYVRRLLEYRTCYYTGVAFTEDGQTARSFDRVDSSKGYVEGNVVACTIDINGKKSNLTYREIECLYGKLSKKNEKRNRYPKILILGNARHGKDTLAEILNRNFGMTFRSSSEAAAEIFIYENLKDKMGYKSFQECFDDRENHREIWYNMITEFNNPDRSKLAKEIITKSDCYVGMRNIDEFNESKSLFDHIIWVDASKRLPEESGSFTIPKSAADMIIDNNGNLEDFESKAIKIGKILFK